MYLIGFRTPERWPICSSAAPMRGYRPAVRAGRSSALWIAEWVGKTGSRLEPLVDPACNVVEVIPDGVVVTPEETWTVVGEPESLTAAVVDPYGNVIDGNTLSWQADGSASSQVLGTFLNQQIHNLLVPLFRREH